MNTVCRKPDRTRLSIAQGTATLSGLFLALFLAVPSGTAEARNPKINVTVGQSVTELVNSPIKTVSIADSDVADVVVVGPQQLLINGKLAGFTTLVVWDENNRSTIYDMVVRNPFSDQQIELRVKVAEVNRTKMEELGVDFLFGDENGARSITGGSYGGQVATPQIPLPIFDGSGSERTNMALRYVSGGTDVAAMIEAMQTDGVLSVLAEPNVVASSGNEASFLSGGEIPIPVAQGGTGANSSITIEWREFGVKVNFVPTIVDSGVINLQVAPEVSSLDYSNSIQLSGAIVPALRVRKAETTVELEDGQVLVIGGLILEEEDSQTKRIPVLGHIPLLGLLFTSSRSIKTRSELLLIVSPHIIRAMPRGTTVTLPAPKEGG